MDDGFWLMKPNKIKEKLCVSVCVRMCVCERESEREYIS